MRLVVLPTAIFLAACGSAFAQSPSSGENLDQGNSVQTTTSASELPDLVKNGLQQAGFSDVKVVPQTFLVRAKDKDGRHVMMLIHENSIMAITRDSHEDGGTTGSGANSGADSDEMPDGSSGQGAGSSSNPDSGK